MKKKFFVLGLIIFFLPISIKPNENEKLLYVILIKHLGVLEYFSKTLPEDEINYGTKVYQFLDSLIINQKIDCVMLEGFLESPVISGMILERDPCYQKNVRYFPRVPCPIELLLRESKVKKFWGVENLENYLSLEEEMNELIWQVASGKVKLDSLNNFIKRKVDSERSKQFLEVAERLNCQRILFPVGAAHENSMRKWYQKGSYNFKIKFFRITVKN